MDYLQILTRALAITWRHKYLWLLALFAGETTTVGLSFGSGSGSSGNSSHRYYGGSESAQAAWNQLATWTATHMTLLWTAGITLAVLGVALFLVSAVANGALVKAGAEHDADRPFGLREAWGAGVRTFWPVLGLKAFGLLVGASSVIVIGGLVVMTAVFAMSGAVAAAIGTGLLAVMLLVVAIPFFIVFGVAIVLGVRAIVLDGHGAADGLRTGMGLIRHRLGRVALFWLLVCLAGAAASVVVALALVVAALPILALTFTAYLAGGWLLALAIGGALVAAWLVVVVTFAGGVKAFTSTCWTIAYPHFDAEPRPAINTQPQPAV